MKRKSPYRHKVHTYKRRTGKTVHQYERGKGEKKTKVSRPRLHHPEQDTTNKYSVHITYVELPAEHYQVNAASYPDAIEVALSKRPHLTVPWHIRVDKQ